MLDSVLLWWLLLMLRWGPAQLRLDAVVELGQTRDKRAVNALISALRRNPTIRSVIATALGKIGDPRATDALMRLLPDDNAPTRSAAASALGEVGDARAAEALATMLAAERISSVCDAAALALIRLRDARGIARGLPTLVARKQRDARGPILDYQDTCEMILPIGAPAVDPLIELLQHDDRDVQEVSVRTLVLLGDARAVEPLIAVLQQGAPPMRRASAEALAKLGDPRATDALVMALGDEDPEVRQAAANLLARSGPRAVEPLVNALQADDPIHRREAARVLGVLRDVSAMEPLMAATTDAAEEVRWAAANALIALGDRRAIEALLRMLLRGDVVTPSYLQSLLSTLRRAIRTVPTETLRELMYLESVPGPPPRSDMGHGFPRPAELRIDVPEFRQVARQELTRRGIED